MTAMTEQSVVRLMLAAGDLKADVEKRIHSIVQASEPAQRQVIHAAMLPVVDAFVGVQQDLRGRIAEIHAATESKIEAMAAETVSLDAADLPEAPSPWERTGGVFRSPEELGSRLPGGPVVHDLSTDPPSIVGDD